MLNNFVKKIQKALKTYPIELAYLFGSQARGEAHSESDIDIAVMFDSSVNPKDYLSEEGRMICLFSEFFPGQEINVINLALASPLLKQNVVLEGQLLYATNQMTRIEFQVKTLHEYEEYSHLNSIYDKFLARKIKNL